MQEIAKATVYAAQVTKVRSFCAKATAQVAVLLETQPKDPQEIAKATAYAAQVTKVRSFCAKATAQVAVLKEPRSGVVKGTAHAAVLYDLPYARIVKATAYGIVIYPVLSGDVYQDEGAERPIYRSGTALPYVSLDVGQSLKTYILTPGEYLFFLMKPDGEIIEYTQTLEGGEITLDIPEDFNQLVAVFNHNLFDWQKQSIRNGMVART